MTLFYKQFAILLLACALALEAEAQTGADSSAAVLATLPDTREKVDRLNAAAADLYDKDVMAGFRFSSEALQLSRKLSYPEGLRLSLIHVGFYYYITGEPHRGLSYYHQAIALKIPEDELLGYAYAMSGNTYRTLARYDSAAYAYHTAIQILKKINKPRRLAYAYKNLGRLYVLQWRNDDAAACFDRAVRLYDSLKQEKGKADTWFSMYELSRNRIDLVNARRFVEDACEIAERTHDEYLMLQCFIQRGDWLSRQGEYQRALEMFFQALNLMKDKNLPHLSLQVYYNIGSVYEELGQNEMGLKYLYEAQTIADQIGFRYEAGKILAAISWIYKNQMNFRLAHQYLDRSLAIRRDIGDEHGISNCYNQRGVVYYQEKKYELALQSLQQSLDIRRKIGHAEGISACLFNIGLVYEDQQDYTRALEFQLDALAIDAKIGNRYSLGVSYNTLGNLYTRLRQFDKAKDYLRQGDAMVQATGSRLLAMGNKYYWSKYFEARGDYAQALRDHQRYAEINDSLYSESSNGKLMEMEALYQVEQKDREIKILNQRRELQDNQIQLQRSRIKQQNIIIIAGISGFVMLALLAFNTYRFNRRIRKAHREISESQEEIQAQSEELIEANRIIATINKNLEGQVEARTSELRQAYKELDTFFYRSSHDFRRPLTTFLGLAEVAKITVKDQNALELFAKVRETAHNLDKMLVKLQSISDLGAQQLVYKQVDVADIFDAAVNNFQEDLEQKGIRVEIDTPAHGSFYTYPAMLRIILENLLENAIFFCGVEQPFIRLQAECHDEEVVLIVSDNGQGIDQQYQDRVFDMYFRGSDRSKGNGLGLYIVKKAVEKLHGRIILQSEYGRGTTFRVSLPRRDQPIG